MLSMIAKLDAFLDEQSPHWWESMMHRNGVAIGPQGASAEATIQFKTKLALAMMLVNLAGIRCLPPELVLKASRKPLADLEQNELMMADLTLSDLGLDYRDHQGLSAFVKALFENDLPGVRAQLQKGADANASVKPWASPLHFAAVKNKPELIEPLIRAGASLITQDTHGYIPLTAAVMSGHLESVRELAKAHRARVAESAEHGEYLRRVLWHVFLLAQHELAQTILPFADAVVNGTDETGVSLLMKVAATQPEGMTKILLAVPQIDVNAEDTQGETALMKAVRNGHVEGVKALLDDARVDANKADSQGFTPLITAVLNGRSEIVKIFASHKPQEGGQPININARDPEGFTALDRACEDGDIDSIKALLEVPGIEVDSKEHMGWSAFRIAIEDARLEAVEALIKIPGINLGNRQDSGWYALHTAAEGFEGMLGDMGEVMATLLKSGFYDVNQRDECGMTPLMVAAYCGNESVVPALLSADEIDQSLRDELGRDALQIAEEKNFHEIAEMIRQHQDLQAAQDEPASKRRRLSD
ncbi:MAG: hypothetical protein RIR70_1448 [Pseudomonadota bacterium]|jgi:ankyrin repeat protein